MVEPLNIDSKAIDEQRTQLADRWIKRLTSEIALREIALVKWQDYRDTVARVREIESELQVGASNGQVHVSEEVSRNWAVVDLLLYYTYQQPEYQTTVNEAKDWALNRGMYSTEKQARANVSSMFSHRKNLWAHIGTGTFKLTRNGAKRAENLTQQLDQKIIEVPTIHEFRVSHPVPTISG